MGRSTVHYADNETNNILKRLHNKLRPAGTPVERVEYIIELLLLRIFEAKIKQDEVFAPLRKLFEGENYRLLFSHLLSLTGEQILSELNKNIFPFYASIISKARNVITENLPQKMQDQLVLMEEVFANSNFTNNVRGGVIAEVIGLVNEIDEKWILRTDLLGDAIESALSETGGTQDLGLYRTPDHIRKMMVEMVDPDFTDTIFDPACGTAGFLFDAYEHVIDKARKTRQFPVENIANQFYRTGIGGIEYQGRIRKMAAVNMYIRGLNPHNIEQGDSLKIFDATKDSNSKSVVISNPPFGAERDQPAYPNVWEEYSREAETTILFVKLMFDLLKQSGRCAVVVSEGFLTWGQNSACALRKLLLNEANLRAIISLPQGVFVSKGGQGAKTSILYFEKGQPTDFIWYYKIENDGFSMGTNRKAIPGSQIPEMLSLFKKVKQGVKPEDTKNSFCVSKEQIEILDPRVAERIRQEVKEKIELKNARKREALIADLNEKLAKSKISKPTYDEKLWQFDNLIEGQVDNEIAKSIEKAHTYNLNLPSYRSNLTDEQVTAWNQTLKDVGAQNGSSLEKRYLSLKKNDASNALKIIASFNPHDALQVDITREYLNLLQSEQLDTHQELKTLEEILRKGYRYPMIKLGDLLKLSGEERVGNRDLPILSMTMHHGLIDQSEKFSKRIASSNISNYKVVKNGEMVVGFPIDEGVLGFQQKYDEAAVSPAYDVWCIKEGVNVKIDYLQQILRSNTARAIYKSKMIGAAGRRRSIPKDIFLNIQFPIPSPEVQKDIVDVVEKKKQIIQAANRIIDFWEPSIAESPDKRTLKEFIVDSLYGISSPLKDQGKYPVLRMNNLDTHGNWYLDDLKYIDDDIKDARRLLVGDFIFNRTNSVELVGKSGVIDFEFPGTYAGYLIRLRFNEALSPYYLRYLFAQKKYRNYFSSIAKPAGGQANINAEELAQTLVDYYPIEVQNQIVKKLDQEVAALNGVRLLKKQAEDQIGEILARVWADV
jgi:type I restriction-modification system DNA methylase subunit/restriction endonuclease S subunit